MGPFLATRPKVAPPNGKGLYVRAATWWFSAEQGKQKIHEALFHADFAVGN